MRTHNPIEAARVSAAQTPAGYYGAALQRSCILARLMRGPATRAELETRCAAQSATKRISELRRQGFTISSGWAPVAGPGGTVQVVTVYCLETRDDRQGQLFAGAAP